MIHQSNSKLKLIIKFKKKKSKIEEITKYNELLKAEIEQLKNDNPDNSISSTSSGNLKRVIPTPLIKPIS